MAVLKIVSKRTKRVTYKAVVNVPAEDGKPRRQISRSAPTRAAAKSLEAELTLEYVEGQRRQFDRLAVVTFFEQWLAQQGDLRESTRKRYRELYAPIVAEYGPLSITKLSPVHVLELYGKLRARNLSPKTILNVHRLWKQAFGDAVRWDLIPRNVVDLVDAPRPVRYEHHVLTLPELRRVFDAADDTPIGPLVRVAAWTGLRLGESLALRWSDIEPGNGRLAVRQARDTTGRISQPKTARSARQITLSPETVSVLSAIGNGDGFVFVNRAGAPFTHGAVNHYWQTIRRNAGVPRARYHDLRHMHASAMISAGWPLPAVSARLGHAQVSTTLDIYAHAMPGTDALLALDIDRVMT